MAEPADDTDRIGRASALAARRAAEYVELWEHTMARLANSEYHAEDLLDDWFAWWGKLVRDSTASAAWMWREFADDRTPQADVGPDGS
jgi:hypothetical protein